MASFQEGSRKSGRRTGSGKGRRHDFIPINGDSSFIHVDSKDLKMQDPPHPPPHTHTHTHVRSHRKTYFPHLRSHLLKLLSVFPFQAVGLGVGESLPLWLSFPFHAMLAHQQAHLKFFFLFQRRTLMEGRGEVV